MSEQLKHNPNKKSADPHVFFAESTLTSDRARTAFHTALQMRLASGEPVTSEKFGKLATKQETALRKVDRLAVKNESQIRLSDFDAPKTIEDVQDRLMRSTFLPVDHPLFKDFMEKTQTTDDNTYWNSPEGEKLAAEINDLSYERIQNEYKLSSPAEAKTFFNERMDESNDAIADLVHTKLPQQENTMALLNETRLMSSPAKLVRYALSPKVSARLQYELLRTLTVAELAAGITQKAGDVKEHVDKFQEVLDETVFDHGKELGDGENTPVYSFHDQQTGKPLWISHLHQPLYPEEVAAFSKIAFLKRSALRTRDANGNVGHIFTNPRTKDKYARITKMVREAENRKKFTGDEMIEPNGIVDLGGIMNVVLDERDNHGDKITELINIHRLLAQDHFKGEKTLEVKDEKSGYTGQSEDHSFRRLLITLNNPDRGAVEEIFESLPSHLQNENQYGTVDEKTGDIVLNGPAHKLYEQTRWLTVAQRFFPPEIYPHKEHKINWDRLLQAAANKAVREIKRENKIPAQRLPKEYILFGE